jgi:hypothetical protein
MPIALSGCSFSIHPNPPSSISTRNPSTRDYFVYSFTHPFTTSTPSMPSISPPLTPTSTFSTPCYYSKAPHTSISMAPIYSPYHSPVSSPTLSSAILVWSHPSPPYLALIYTTPSPYNPSPTFTNPVMHSTTNSNSSGTTTMSTLVSCSSLHSHSRSHMFETSPLASSSMIDSPFKWTHQHAAITVTVVSPGMVTIRMMMIIIIVVVVVHVFVVDSWSRWWEVD